MHKFTTGGVVDSKLDCYLQTILAGSIPRCGQVTNWHLRAQWFILMFTAIQLYAGLAPSAGEETNYKHCVVGPSENKLSLTTHIK